MSLVVKRLSVCVSV